MKRCTCVSGDIASPTKLKTKQVWVRKGFMENPNWACAVFRLWFAAHERQGLSTTGKRIDSLAYVPIYSGWRVFPRPAEALQADQDGHAIFIGHATRPVYVKDNFGQQSKMLTCRVRLDDSGANPRSRGVVGEPGWGFSGENRGF